MANVVQEKVLNIENDSHYMHRVKTFNKIAPKGISILTKSGIDVSEEASESDAIMLRSHSLHDYKFSDSLKAIGRAGAGVNNIPVDVCTDAGIVVFNAPGANANAVKELVVAGMLLSSRDIIGGINYSQTISDQGSEISKLVEKNKSRFKGYEIFGKRLGVIGLGAIGLQVANAGLSLGMEVQGYDPFISVNAAWELSSDVDRSSSLEQLIKTSDFISVHVPFSDNTKGFINADRIQSMKSGAVLLNFSRHGLVDEDAMTKALNDRSIHKYVSDFPNELLVNNPHVISIPHLGASTDEAEENCAIMIANQLRDFLQNGTIYNSVNFPNCALERSTEHRITILNKNVPTIIGQVTGILAEANLNISEMVSKSRNDIAYNIIDLNETVTDEILQKIYDIDGVIRVRQLSGIAT